MEKEEGHLNGVDPAGRSRSGALAWSVRLFDQHTILLLTALFVSGAVSILWHLNRLSNNLVQTTALQNGKLYSEVLAEFRTLYTTEVVEVVRSQGIEVTHDFAGKANAIPLPATLSILLGNRIGEHGDGIRTRLYSGYPFPWREKTGGLNDEFSRAAWIALQENPDRPYTRFEEVDGRAALRYATADLMRSSCVNCHNSHPDTPKNDWKTGDVRGVLEVIYPMDTAVAQSRTILRETLLLMAAMSFLGVAGLALAIGRLRRSSQGAHRSLKEMKRANEELTHFRNHLEELVQKRTDDLEKAHSELIRKERMAVLGRLTGVVSHDLRNPLGTVRNSLFSIGDAIERNQPARAERALKLAERNVQRCDSIIGELLDYTRKRELRLEATDIDVWLGRVLDEEDFPDGIECLRRLRSGVHLPIDQEHLRRAVLNATTNAVQALQEENASGNRLTVETRVSCERLELRFIDSGPGMSAEIIEQVFEPLFTTKDSGVGLGVPIIRDIMTEHHGGVEVVSEIGHGSTFTLWLPLRNLEGES